MKILLIEDDSRISDFVLKGLEENGFSVTLAVTGEVAREKITSNNWDLILMDIMLPGIDGIQLTKLIRHKKNTTPIIVISALGETIDKVTALDSGADDYITKPFHFKELISRINALTRRAKFNQESHQNIYSCDDLRVNPEEFTVERAGQSIELSPTEFKLLLYLLENKNKVMGRTQILHEVWGINYQNNTNVVDVYISYLRNKIDKNQSNKLIKTIKGMGYSIKEQ
jgi:two-component system, OmpR family, response regulator